MRREIRFFLWGMIVFKTLTVQASTFVATQNMSFGTLIPLVSAGSFSLSLAGALTTNGNVALAPGGTLPSQGIALYTGTGLSLIADLVTISILSSSVTLTNNIAGGGTITVNNFVSDPSISLTLLGPQSTVRIAGTANFTSASKRGTYTGSVQMRGVGLLSGTATATIPITLTFWGMLGINQTVPLNFGAIEMRGGNSVVRIAPGGNRTIVSGASGINLVANPAPTAGQFLITGEPNTAVSTQLPASMTLTGSNGGTMLVNAFAKTTNPANGTLNAIGSMTLSVGADLNINTNQMRGTYTGTYPVIANY